MYLILRMIFINFSSDYFAKHFAIHFLFFPTFVRGILLLKFPSPISSSLLLRIRIDHLGESLLPSPFNLVFPGVSLSARHQPPTPSVIILAQPKEGRCSWPDQFQLGFRTQITSENVDVSYCGGSGTFQINFWQAFSMPFTAISQRFLWKPGRSRGKFGWHKLHSDFLGSLLVICRGFQKAFFSLELTPSLCLPISCFQEHLRLH